MSGTNWEQAMIDLINILEQERNKLIEDLDSELRSIGREVVAGKTASSSSITRAKNLQAKLEGLMIGMQVGLGFRSGQLLVTDPKEPSAS